jgi:hypothetical protein
MKFTDYMIIVYGIAATLALLVGILPKSMSDALYSGVISVSTWAFSLLIITVFLSFALFVLGILRR